jgi:hypothetical protein
MVPWKINPTGNDPKPAAEKEQGWIPWAIQNLKAKYKQRNSRKYNEYPQDRSSRQTACATIVIAMFTVVLAGVGTFQGCVAQRTLDELQSEQRPWISAADFHLIGNIVHDGVDCKLPVNSLSKTPASLPLRKCL